LSAPFQQYTGEIRNPLTEIRQKLRQSIESLVPEPSGFLICIINLLGIGSFKKLYT
jgi:hypothetical protein